MLPMCVISMPNAAINHKISKLVLRVEAIIGILSINLGKIDLSNCEFSLYFKY